jgi:hypothetical protein
MSYRPCGTTATLPVTGCAAEPESWLVGAVRCFCLVRKEALPPPWYGSDGTICIVARIRLCRVHQTSVRPYSRGSKEGR